jgi:hypothetical protein
MNTRTLTATLATITLAAILHADTITGNIKVTPSLTHYGNNPAATLVETISDVYLWAGNSSALGTGATATAMSLIYAQSTNIAAGASDSYNAGTRTMTWNTNAAAGGAADGVGYQSPWTNNIAAGGFGTTNQPYWGGTNGMTVWLDSVINGTNALTILKGTNIWRLLLP